MTTLTTATADSGATTRRSADPDGARGRKLDDATDNHGRHAARDEAAQQVRRHAPVLYDDTHKIGTTSEGDVELVEIAAAGGVPQVHTRRENAVKRERSSAERS